MGRKHSKTWRFADINYEAASDDDRRSIFLSYGGVLNSLPTDAAAKITICNQRLNPVDFERTILMRERGDKLDCYRKEYNHILLDKMAQSNNLVQEKFITLSIAQRKIEDTRAYFRRVDGALPRASGDWTPAHGLSPTMTAYASCTTFSAPARNSISPLTRRKPSAVGWTSATRSARTA